MNFSSKQEIGREYGERNRLPERGEREEKENN